MTTPIHTLTLREARHIHGWSQAELARRARVSVGTVSRIETGHTDYNFNVEGVARLADAVGLRPEELRLPKGLSHLGRRVGSGKTIVITDKSTVVTTQKHLTIEDDGSIICGSCNIELSLTGECISGCTDDVQVA